MPCIQGEVQGKETSWRVIYRISWKNYLWKVMGKSRRPCEREWATFILIRLTVSVLRSDDGFWIAVCPCIYIMKRLPILWSNHLFLKRLPIFEAPTYFMKRIPIFEAPTYLWSAYLFFKHLPIYEVPTYLWSAYLLYFMKRLPIYEAPIYFMKLRPIYEAPIPFNGAFTFLQFAFIMCYTFENSTACCLALIAIMQKKI